MSGHGPYHGDKLRVANEVVGERIRQDAKWGEQNHPSLPFYADADDDRAVALPAADTLKLIVDKDKARREDNWLNITLEELAEAIECGSDRERRGELVQLAAVVHAWIECIDRRQQEPARDV